MEKRMTNERAGMLNERSVLDDVKRDMDEFAVEWTSKGRELTDSVKNYAIVISTIEVMRHRGLINELGIEILKRDGVIK
jgi:hypothetical protein